ncbi:transcriptional regulator, LysR family protein [Roseobacter sp. SK209-2-6]|uniref:LysR family transcriptional regulator n=1 Tax=Roseobacter sp. SK209-2-6 TaxID=388739 RepID=UPI0000F3D625|nr:LysR family transcriptional regulator [Roseobacter sp. SK209-2-6]EBA15767.1 transcriptional regulator, LysR family protein [Roseobacter sp. SK209-2-6]
MRLEWIEDILAVLKTGSLAQAAEARHRTQSAFSRRIAALEAYLGTELFDRKAKPLRPLPNVLAQEAEMRELVMRLQSLEQSLSAGSKSRRKTLTIAGSHSLATTQAPRLVEEIHAEFGLSVSVQSADRDQAILSLLSGEADFALFFQSAQSNEVLGRLDVDVAPMGQDLLLPVAAPPLWQRLQSQPRAPYPLITYPKDVFFGRLVSQKMAPLLMEDRPMDVVASTPLSHAVLQLVLQGTGIGWLPQSLISDQLDQGLLRVLPDPLPDIPLQLVLVRMAKMQKSENAKVWDYLTSKLRLSA